MNNWSLHVAERVTAKAGGDSYYQELLCQCEIKEIEYHRIICKLLPTEQEQVDDYVAVCEELEYRRTQLAYELGLEDGAREGR